MPEFQKFAKLPLVPLVVTPDDKGLQDSTPIIETMETSFPKPSIYPEEITSRFVSALLEEFGDEWGNKWMFHLRWAAEVDQLSAAKRIAMELLPNENKEKQLAMATQFQARMVNRVWFVGATLYCMDGSNRGRHRAEPSAKRIGLDPTHVVAALRRRVRTMGHA